MPKSTHPFVERMNAAKAFHRAMRAGAEKEATPEAKATETPAETPTPGVRHLTLTRKTPTDTPPPKGVLSIVVPQ